MQRAADPSLRKVYFEAYADIALTAEAIEQSYRVWSGEEPVERLPLSENDRIELAQLLAVKMPDRADAIFERQLESTENPDNRRKLAYLRPSVSPDAAIRDAFFASLAEERMRETESWVLDALAICITRCGQQNPRDTYCRALRCCRKFNRPATFSSRNGGLMRHSRITARNRRQQQCAGSSRRDRTTMPAQDENPAVCRLAFSRQQKSTNGTCNSNNNNDRFSGSW